MLYIHVQASHREEEVHLEEEEGCVYERHSVRTSCIVNVSEMTRVHPFHCST